MSDKSDPTTRDDFDDELEPEYDPELFKKGVRGKYYRRATRGTNVVRLAPDVAAVFHDEQAVNDALRMLMTIAKQTTPEQPAKEPPVEPRKKSA